MQSLQYYATTPQGSTISNRGARCILITATDEKGTPITVKIYVDLTLLNVVSPVLTAQRPTVLYKEGSDLANVGMTAGIGLKDDDNNELFLMRNGTVTLTGVLDIGMEEIKLEGQVSGKITTTSKKKKTSQHHF